MTDNSNLPRPLGPNEGPAPSIKSRDGGVTDQPYTYQAWPAWRYNPETGNGQVFESAEEVPDGWTNIPPGTSEAGEEPVEVNVAKLEEFTKVAEDKPAVADEDDDEEDVVEETRALTKDELAALGQSRLAAILFHKNETLSEDDQIEFLANWPKVKLAETILANGGYTDTVQKD